MGTVTEEEIIQALEKVIDPELGASVVDLGMVRFISHQDGGAVRVGLSLTTLACPLWELFEDQVAIALEPLGVAAETEFVLRPPWTPELMNHQVRDELIAAGMILPGSVQGQGSVVGARPQSGSA